ncbi:hypothetical protein [Streptomyces sp. SID3343]|uniref:hypothetical protein n=1 Tax=Streptomyces sp. SID3343 TaxID=2690260 RepID=UPI00137204BC|nr:hypothetical protein [Streptomyces sp. SID3343]MYV99299.1 hypothetical protein [Streptomyces sp. SID3343]
MTKASGPMAVAAAALVLTAAVGCGIPSTGAVDAGAPAGGIIAPADASHEGSVYVYLVTGHRVVRVLRSSPGGDGPQAALDVLLAGPTPEDAAVGRGTEIPTKAAPGWVSIEERVLHISLGPNTPALSLTALQQIVCTVTTASTRAPASTGPATSMVSVATPAWRVDGVFCLD